jgi:BirA family transcriptional regulator, biotin operon repressor / biotin---[acetyl-CoA-carboxylase] ligase
VSSSEPVALTAELVTPRIRGRFGVPYLWHESCSSTQDVLRGSGLPEGAVAVAEHQRAGRGRSGRRWDAGRRRAVLVSILLRPPFGSTLPQLSLVTGLAVADAVETVTGLPAGLKWPNDVLLGGRKVSGILLEGDDDAIVCGIGVNVSQEAGELPVGTAPPATSLVLETGIPIDRATVLTTTLHALERRYDAWRHDGIEPLLPALEERNALRGRRARSGDLEGIVGPLAADGRITLEVEGGESRAIVSGELVLI